MEAAFPYMAVNLITYIVAGVIAPISLLAIKSKALPIYNYEWIILLAPIIVFRLMWLTQLTFKTDGNIAGEPLIIGILISGIYVVRYIYREAYSKAAPACFAISCFIPILVYLCMPVMPG